MTTRAPTRKIGQTTVSNIGFGALGIGGAYGKVPSDEERFQLLDAACANGSTHWDTADIYMDSEELIGKWLKRTGKRNDIFLATKFGFVFGTPGRLINGSPEYVREALDRSLQKLGVDYIDLFYLHRIDSTVPIEYTVAAMAQGVRAGKVKYLGLSECSAASLRRAHAVHPIAAVQCEYSPFTLDIEDEKIGLLKAARELGVAVVAYAPLGRGLITGSINSLDDLDRHDWRRTVPRYSPENFPNIVKLSQGLKAIGERNHCTASQVALAWLLAQGDDIIPIPGTTKIKYLEENIAASQVHLAPADLKQVRDEARRADAAHGDRYPSGMAQLLYVDSPELD